MHLQGCRKLGQNKFPEFQLIIFTYFPNCVKQRKIVLLSNRAFYYYVRLGYSHCHFSRYSWLFCSVFALSVYGTWFLVRNVSQSIRYQFVHFFTDLQWNSVTILWLPQSISNSLTDPRHLWFPIIVATLIMYLAAMLPLALRPLSPQLFISNSYPSLYCITINQTVHRCQIYNQMQRSTIKAVPTTVIQKLLLPSHSFSNYSKISDIAIGNAIKLYT
jgi:hypothetical protein